MFNTNKMKLTAVFTLLLSFSCQYYCKNCKCGQFKLKSNSRIFNGKDADDYQYPYCVYIEFNTKSEEVDDYEWGGALISKKHILTCAHGFYPTGNEKSLT